MATTSRFAGKVAIVTGSSSGFGEAIALRLASQGARVTLCGRDPDRLRGVFNQAVQISGGDERKFHFFLGDMNSPNVRQAVVSETIQTFNRLDILVANHGISLPGMTMDATTEEDFDLLFNTNLKSYFFLIQQALKHLEKSKGNIVCTSSITSAMPCAQTLAYPIFKASLDHLVRCLALDLGPRGIRVNAVRPAFVATRIRRNFDDMEKLNRDWTASEKKKQPLMERVTTVDDVAKMVTFLASGEASMTTGQSIAVDAGRSLTSPYGTGIDTGSG